jgi:hypothetical protein
MKTPIQLRTAILEAIPDLIGIRYFGSTVQPSILMLPDDDLQDGGVNLPAIINGSPVKYQGIEIIIYRNIPLDEFEPYLNGEVSVSEKSWVLLKDHKNIDRLTLDQINAYRAAAMNGDVSADLEPITQDNLKEGLSKASAKVCKLLDLYKKLPPPKQIDQTPLLDSIIIGFDYVGWM